MHYRTVYLLGLVLTFSPFPMKAQKDLSIAGKETGSIKQHAPYVEAASEPGWVLFRDDNPFEAEKIFLQQPDLFNLTSKDEMRFWKERYDRAGNRHLRYIQYHDGIRVEGAELTVHERNGKIHLVSGIYASQLEIGSVPQISYDHAIDLALAALPAEIYLWEDPRAESRYKERNRNAAATLYPQPELLIVRNARPENEVPEYRLAWKVVISAKMPRRTEALYLDAATGEVLRRKNLEHACGTVNNWPDFETTFNGEQFIEVSDESCYQGYVSEASYDDCVLTNSAEYSFDAATGDPYCYNSILLPWNNGMQMGFSSLYAIDQVMDAFKISYDHEGFSGTGDVVDVYNEVVFYDENDLPFTNGASFNSFTGDMHLGRGISYFNSLDDYNTVDIVGHEFTHGIINDAHFDALDLEGEAGAVNEALCDLFGEFANLSGLVDWKLGAEKSDGAIRHYDNPKAYGFPDTYLGDYWYSGSGDNGGIHTNCTVLDYCFYLMANGGSGTNDHGETYDVTPLANGKWDMYDIAWQAMMQYIDGDDDFITTRNCFIQAAKDLFGSCSQEVIITGEAFKAVGISHYAPQALATICGTYSSSLPTVIEGILAVSNAVVFNSSYITACTATLNAGTNIVAKSSEYVNLLPGFEAKSGAVFEAYLNECSTSKYDPNDLRLIVPEKPIELSSETRMEISMHPNPADNETVISYVSGSEPCTFTISDIAGRVMHESTWQPATTGNLQEIRLDTSPFPNGIYACILKSGNIIESEKLVVQH